MIALSPQELQTIVTRAGSWKRTAQILGLNAKELAKLRSDFPEVSIKRLDSWSPTQFTEEMRRLKTVQIFAMVHGCQVSEVHAFAKRFNFDLRTLIQPIGETSGTGRKGELYFKSKMETFIREDAFETQGHTAPYDFVCSGELGLVNVKTANRDRYTAKCRANNPNFWDFSTKGMRDCDTLALVPLNPHGEPMCIVLVKTMLMKDFESHITLTGKDLQVSSAVIVPFCGMEKVYNLRFNSYTMQRLQGLSEEIAENLS